MRKFGKMIIAFMTAMAVLLSGPLSSYFITPAFAYTSQTATVRANTLNLRKGPGTGYSKIMSLVLGDQVVVIDEVTGDDGEIWCEVTYNDGEITGYVSKEYLGMASQETGLSDELFEALLSNQGFPESYKPYLRAIHKKYPNWTFKAKQTGLDWSEAVKNESLIGRNLVYTTSRSSWKSIAEGAYNWNTSSWPGFDGSAWVAASEDIIKYYMDPRNFLDTTYIFQFLDQKYDAGVHTAAGLEKMLKGTFMESTYTGGSSESGPSDNTETSGPVSETTGPTAQIQTQPAGTQPQSQGITSGATGVVLIGPGEDPDNPFLSSNTQRAAHSSSSENSQGSASGPSGEAPQSGSTYGPGGSVQTQSSKKTGGPGGSSPGGSSINYANILMQAAAESNVNPYVLAAMIIQEQGKDGNSDLISGRTSSYSGIYNFYNVEAYADGNMSAVTRGLWWASQSGAYDRPWNSIDKAVIGGAKFYGENYTMADQNTFYLKKFNVLSSDNLYKHQFMTNVQAAASEGYHLAQAYSAEVRTSAHDFEIPVYKNMPSTPCPLPSGDGSPNYKLASLGVEGFSFTPTFNADTLSYDLIVDTSVESINIITQTMDSNAKVSGNGQVSLSSGINTLDITVKAQNGNKRTYRINVVRQVGGPTYTTDTGETNVVVRSGSNVSPGETSGPGSTDGGGPGGVQENTSQIPEGPGAGNVQTITMPPGSGQEPEEDNKLRIENVPGVQLIGPGM